MCKPMKSMYRSINEAMSLCLVTDAGFRPADEFLSTVETALKNGATMVQYREKSGHYCDKEIYDRGMELVTLCHRFGVQLVVDDRLDIAMAIGADGLHIGQNDLPLPVAKQIWPEGRIFGVSVADLREMRLAQEQGADYLGVGAFPTTTKKDYSNVEAKLLSSMVKESSLPMMAIGGIQAENASIPIGWGCVGVAVISAIWKAPDPAVATRHILETVRKAKGDLA